MPEVLALGAAVVFGLVHFFSGLLTRRAGSFAVALYGQLGGVLLVSAGLLLYPGHHVTASALLWGALSGVGSGIGVAFLFRGLSVGNMSVVVPLSDVGSVALPVLIGVAFLGNRPSLPAWAGVLAALPALWLVSRTGPTARVPAARGSLDGLVAGAGFALQFVAIARVDLDAGLWPVLAARLLALATVVPIALRLRAPLRLPRNLVPPTLVVGSAGSVAIVLYLLATQHQLFALATVLASLYPAIPVVLALVFLHERLSRTQLAGLGLTAASVVLISMG